MLPISSTAPTFMSSHAVQVQAGPRLSLNGQFEKEIKQHRDTFYFSGDEPQKSNPKKQKSTHGGRNKDEEKINELIEDCSKIEMTSFEIGQIIGKARDDTKVKSNDSASYSTNYHRRLTAERKNVIDALINALSKRRACMNIPRSDASRALPTPALLKNPAHPQASTSLKMPAPLREKQESIKPFNKKNPSQLALPETKLNELLLPVRIECAQDEVNYGFITGPSEEKIIKRAKERWNIPPEVSLQLT